MPLWMNDNTPVGNPVGAVGALSMVLAGSLLVFLRRNIGVRLLVRRRFVVVGVLLIGWSYIETPFDQPLALFAAAGVALAFVHHTRHMIKIRNGDPEWHSYDTGQSLLFSFLPLPRSLTQVVIEPALCGALGWWLANRSDATFYLGWWIVYSSIALFFLENAIRIARREGLFDLGDTIVESVHFARMSEKFTNPPPGSGPAQPQRRDGIWWGFLRALHQAVKPPDGKRKNKRGDERQRQNNERRR